MSLVQDILLFLLITELRIDSEKKADTIMKNAW